MRSHKDRSTVGLGRLRGRCLQTRLNDSEAGQAEPPGVKGLGAGWGGGGGLRGGVGRVEESLLQKYVLAAASQGDAGCRCNLLFWPGAAISLLFEPCGTLTNQ